MRISEKLVCMIFLTLAFAKTADCYARFECAKIKSKRYES